MADADGVFRRGALGEMWRSNCRYVSNIPTDMKSSYQQISMQLHYIPVTDSSRLYAPICWRMKLICERVEGIQ